MSETQVVQESVTGEQPVAPVEHIYKYQPRDPENGQPIGGEQVIKYDGTPEDLGAKMVDQNVKLIALNRKLNKQARLSAAFPEEIPANAPRFDESKYMLQPEPLTAEERIQLSQDLQDPEKFDSASKRIVRATIGDPDALRTRLARIEQQQARVTVQEEAKAFMRERSDYFPCNENLQDIAAWIEKNQLDPVKENFMLAYDTLKDYLKQKPAPVSVQPAAQPEIPAQPAAPAQPTRPVASGLTRQVASDSGPVGVPNHDTFRKELEKMTGDEYGRRYKHEKGFKEKVDALDREDAARRQGRV
jgi:hypothetical protein